MFLQGSIKYFQVLVNFGDGSWEQETREGWSWPQKALRALLSDDFSQFLLGPSYLLRTPTSRTVQERSAGPELLACHKEAIEAFTICLTSDICFLQARRCAACRGTATHPHQSLHVASVGLLRGKHQEKPLERQTYLRTSCPHWDGDSWIPGGWKRWECCELGRLD